MGSISDALAADDELTLLDALAAKIADYLDDTARTQPRDVPPLTNRLMEINSKRAEIIARIAQETEDATYAEDAPFDPEEI